MDIAVKKVELIEWLARIKDKKVIQSLDELKKISIKEGYENLTPKSKGELQKKLDRSRADILAGRVYSQENVEAFFKEKSNRLKKA